MNLDYNKIRSNLLADGYDESQTTAVIKHCKHAVKEETFNNKPAGIVSPAGETRIVCVTIAEAIEAIAPGSRAPQDEVDAAARVAQAEMN